MRVAPEQHCARRFEFGLAHKQVAALGRAAPVDAVSGIFLCMAAILPELLARARAAATGAADMGGLRGLGLEVQVRQLAGQRLGFSTKVGGGSHSVKFTPPSARGR